MMKILVPIPFDLSVLAHGRNLRIVHLLGELSGRCHVTCLAPDARRAAAVRAVLPDVETVVAGAQADVSELPRRNGQLSWRRRALTYFGYEPHLEAAVLQHAAHADVVLGFDVPSVVYLSAVAERRGALAGAQADQPARQGAADRRPRIVCDLIDAPRFAHRSLPIAARLSPAGIKAALATAVLQRYVLGTFDALTAVAPRDAALLSLATGRTVTVVPNGVVAPERPPADRTNEPLVVFTGAMDFPPNEAAACHLVRRIWPRVQRALGDLDRHAGIHIPAHLAIVGAKPTRKVQRLSAAPGVTVTGHVDDLAGWLRRARVAVAPMVSGSGMKNKVLEACAAACPVIASPLGAAGLPTGQDHGIIVAATASQLSEQIVALLVDGAAARTIGQAGHRMVRERFSWSAAADKLLDLLPRDTEPVSDRTPADVDTVPLCRHQLHPGGKPRPSSEEALIHAAP